MPRVLSGKGRGRNTAELSSTRPVHWNHFDGITKSSWNAGLLRREP